MYSSVNSTVMYFLFAIIFSRSIKIWFELLNSVFGYVEQRQKINLVEFLYIVVFLFLFFFLCSFLVYFNRGKGAKNMSANVYLLCLKDILRNVTNKGNIQYKLNGLKKNENKSKQNDWMGHGGAHTHTPTHRPSRVPNVVFERTHQIDKI